MWIGLRDWEVCGVPARNPLATRDADERDGSTTFAWAMYNVRDLVAELEHICSFLERMPQPELEKWLALQDRQLSFNYSDPEMDAAEMNTKGFMIPGPLLERIRSLHLRLMIGFHPASNVDTKH